MSLFKIFLTCTSIVFAAAIKNFGGIPSFPVAFLGFNDFIILFISAGFAFG